MSHPCWDLLRARDHLKTPRLGDLWKLFEDTGTAIIPLALLKRSQVSVAETLKTQNEDKNAMSVVQRLIHQGALRFKVKEGTTSLWAVQNKGGKTDKEMFWITPEELETLPSQLALTSGVVVTGREEDIEGDRLPAALGEGIRFGL